MARKKSDRFIKNRYDDAGTDCTACDFGLAVLFSSSEYNGRVRFGDSAYYFKKQLFATALGLMTMYIVAETDYRFFVRLAPAAYLLSMGLSTAVLFVGQEINAPEGG